VNTICANARPEGKPDSADRLITCEHGTDTGGNWWFPKRIKPLDEKPVYLTTNGYDMLWMDTVSVVYHTGSGYVRDTFGENNKFGWCLSWDQSDWVGFKDGTKVPAHKCFKSIKFGPGDSVKGYTTMQVGRRLEEENARLRSPDFDWDTVPEDQWIPLEHTKVRTRGVRGDDGDEEMKWEMFGGGERSLGLDKPCTITSASPAGACAAGLFCDVAEKLGESDDGLLGSCATCPSRRSGCKRGRGQPKFARRACREQCKTVFGSVPRSPLE